jgi:hypothetical protein
MGRYIHRYQDLCFFVSFTVDLGVRLGTANLSRTQDKDKRGKISRKRVMLLHGMSRLQC